MEWCCRMRPVQPNHLHQPLYLQGRDRSQPSNKLSKRKKAQYPAVARYRAVNNDADVACIIDSVNAANIKIGRTNKILPKNFPSKTENRPPDSRKRGAWRPVRCRNHCQNRPKTEVTVMEKACVQQAPKRHILTIQQ